MSRTNIDIDDELMAAAMKATGQKTKKGTVEEAMRRALKAVAFSELAEGMRGIEWDDGLAESADRLELAEDAPRFETKR
jgi:Arc/MetJ family transcription regulator